MFEVVVGVAWCSERGLLLIRRSENESSSGKWEFGGGAVEDHDHSLEQAVRREIKEETGLSAKVVSQGDPYFDEYSKGGRLKLYPFLLKVEENDKVELSREHDSYKWVEIEEVDEYETLGELKSLQRLGLI